MPNNKIINQNEIDQVLKLVFDLNCPAPQWEAVKKLLSNLPEEEKQVKSKDKTKN